MVQAASHLMSSKPKCAFVFCMSNATFVLNEIKSSFTINFGSKLMQNNRQNMDKRKHSPEKKQICDLQPKRE